MFLYQSPYQILNQNRGPLLAAGSPAAFAWTQMKSKKRYPIKRSRSLLFLLLTTTQLVFDNAYIRFDWVRIIPVRVLPPRGGYQVKMGGLIDHYHDPSVWNSP